MINSNKTQNILLGTLLLGVFWIKAAALLSMPFLTLYLYKNAHISPTMIGIIVGTQPIAYCISSIFSGHLSNIFKKQTLILVSVFIGMVSFLGFYCAGIFLAGTTLLIALALMNVLNGVSAALFSPVVRAVLTELAQTTEQNIQYLHLRYLIINIGAVVGPLIGAYAGVAGGLGAFFLTGILYAVYGVMLIIVLNKYLITDNSENTQLLTHEDKPNLLTALSYLFTNKKFMGLMLSITIFSISYVQFTTTLGIVVNQNIVNGTLFFSWLISFNAIVVLILQPLIYRIVKSKDQKAVALYGYIAFIIIGLLPIVLPIGKAALIIFVLGLTLAEILIFPTSSILISEFTSKKYHGMAYGIIELSSLGTAIGPALGGLILDHSNTQMYFVVQLIIGLCAIMVYSACMKKSKATII